MATGVWRSLTAAVLIAALTGCSQAGERTFTLTPRGGQLNAGAVTLTVPPGAVSEAVRITIDEGEATELQVVRGTAHTLTPLEQGFLRPVELTLWLDPRALPPGARGSDLWLGRVTGAAWVRTGEHPDVDPSRWVSASVTVLGTYAVLTDRVAAADAGPDLPAAADLRAPDGGPPADAPGLDRPRVIPDTEFETFDIQGGADAVGPSPDTTTLTDASGTDA